jgi:hypothetical protein
MKEVKWAGHVAHIGAKRNACTFLAGKRVGKRPIETSRRKWEDIKIDGGRA